MLESRTVGVVGGRGYVGAEMLGLLSGHPNLEPVFACSRGRAGDRVADHVPGAADHLIFEDLTPEEAAERGADAVVLCLPDGGAANWVSAFEGTDACLLDVSSDHRFTNTWTYGLTEHFRDALRGARRISNPGCYATAAQLALRPLQPLLAETAHCFGVSGYSGAGRAPSPRNDPALLADGVTPYKLVDHTHEREISRHLGKPVRFSPHVAPFFRGIVLSVQAKLTESTNREDIYERYALATSAEPLVEATANMPRVQEVTESDGAIIGGFAVNPARPSEVALVCVIDNLGKGAAGQAVQNLNLALGFPEAAGLRPVKREPTG